MKGDLLVFAAMMIFGSYSLFLRFFPLIPTLAFLFFFQLVGAIAFFILVQLQKKQKIEKKLQRILVTLAFVAIANDLLYFLSFRITQVANAAFAHQMASVFLLFLAPIFLQEKTKKYEWLSLVVALVGISILYSTNLTVTKTNDLLGITLALLSGLFYALLIVHYRYLTRKGLGISTINFYRYLYSAILLSPIMFIFNGFIFTGKDLPLLILFGIVFAVIASGIHNLGISKTRALHVSIIGKSEPVIASLYAFLFLKETPSVNVLLGGLLIVGSSMWLALKREI